MRTFIIAAATLCALGIAPSALAQDKALEEDEVTNFLINYSAKAEDLVNAKDWDGLQAWMQGLVNDDARFAMKGSIVSQRGGTFTYSGTMSGQQVKELHSSGTMGMRPMMQAIEDYTLDVDLRGVSLLPNGDAQALVQFRESGRIDPEELAQAMGQAKQSEGRSALAAESQPRGAVFQATANCDLRLTRASAGGIEVSLAACDTTTAF